MRTHTHTHTHTVLITGGAGYIGTHTAVALQEAGYDVMVLDNFSNSCKKSLDRVQEITGKPIVKLFEVDILDKEALHKVAPLLHVCAVCVCQNVCACSARASRNRVPALRNRVWYILRETAGVSEEGHTL